MKTRSPSLERRADASGISRRVVLAAAAAAPLLARCSSDPNSDTSALTRLLVQSVNPFSSGRSVTLSEVASTPFASLGVRVGSGPQTMLILATQSGQSTVWTSGSHVALEIQYGRVVRTAGLPHDLTGSAFSGPDPLAAGLQNTHASVLAKRSVDFADRNSYGNEVDSTLAVIGPADVDILGTRVKAIHAVEHCTSRPLAWSFVNEYWAGSLDGRMWRSIQCIHPDLDALEIELFRPPRV